MTAIDAWRAAAAGEATADAVLIADGRPCCSSSCTIWEMRWRITAVERSLPSSAGGLPMSCRSASMSISNCLTLTRASSSRSALAIFVKSSVGMASSTRLMRSMWREACWRRLLHGGGRRDRSSRAHGSAHCFVGGLEAHVLAVVGRLLVVIIIVVRELDGRVCLRRCNGRGRDVAALPIVVRTAGAPLWHSDVARRDPAAAATVLGEEPVLVPRAYDDGLAVHDREFVGTASRVVKQDDALGRLKLLDLDQIEAARGRPAKLAIVLAVPPALGALVHGELVADRHGQLVLERRVVHVDRDGVHGLVLWRGGLLLVD
eukprot:Unigene12979_Nuclearia_a/m.39381 Unigene12979_Nuclearia_a/g.39381  ORF Unigene12979_Nuclearia_a/g.39381 Unigene12979_Nuclearia_a/m.39381 type:complete len:317 (+) Unigene12979_Nuclearia_a:388-1338(+)